MPTFVRKTACTRRRTQSSHDSTRRRCARCARGPSTPTAMAATRMRIPTRTMVCGCCVTRATMGTTDCVCAGNLAARPMMTGSGFVRRVLPTARSRMHSLQRRHQMQPPWPRPVSFPNQIASKNLQPHPPRCLSPNRRQSTPHASIASSARPGHRERPPLRHLHRLQ